jgi:hypothetical protein
MSAVVIQREVDLIRSRSLALLPSMAIKQAKVASVYFLTFTWLKLLED